MKKLILSLVMILSFVGLSASAEVLNNPQADYPGSPEIPLTRELIAKLYQLNKAGNVLDAWELLATQNDGYAISAAAIFGDDITVGKCVVEQNWRVVVGDEVRARLYHSYAKLYQYSYIRFLDRNHRYPNSLDIEKLYQKADDALGLPQSVSVDLLFNTIPADWKTRVFFDRLSSLVGVGNMVMEKRWYDYTELSYARVVSQSITAKDVNVRQAKDIFKKTAALVAKCMARILKPQATGPAHE